ncbi:M15 family peptidase [Streptomyces sp. SID8379]|uniref:M15 family metallopeptidase n=1 Tax=unclassified Streptomyces TaxID=2593676 RepID=UPI00036E462A|nr:M15 family metallopeptidase [Streptomyces sp. HmicA12]MYW64432.1 M15 family peptidase [Streptomyces sp. SID8379]
MQNVPRSALAALAVTAVLLTTPPAQAQPASSTVPTSTTTTAVVPGLKAVVSAAPAAKLAHTYRRGCPVPPGRLRLIRMNHWGFDGKVHRGELIVSRQAVSPMLYVFGRAFAAKFPIRRMKVMAEYRGSDTAAMKQDNTSAFNCRAVTGSPGKRSQHSYGNAIDINTLENPYVDTSGRVYPPAGRRYLRRDRPVKGMIRRGDVITTAMRKVGWQWGGRWAHPDYQHFSANGR